MKKLTQGATRLFVLALGLGLATTGWADMTLSYSGFVPKDEANKTDVFSGVTLSDINSGKYVLVGKLGGGNVNDKGGQAGAYAYSLSSGTLTVIFERVDDGYCKCVEVKFTETDGTIYAYASRAGYLTGGQPGLSASQINWWGTVVTSNTDAGYGIYDICLSTPGSSSTITNQGIGDGNGVGNIAATDTYTLQLVADSPFASGGYVRLNSFAFGMNSSGDALNAKYVTCKNYKGDTITSALVNGTGSVSTSTKFSNNSLKQSYSFGSVGDAAECIVKVGTTYAFALTDANGDNVLQRVYCRKTTDRAYSPVAQSASMAAEWRMTQELKATVLASLETSTGGTWSSLPFVDAPTTEWSNSSYAPVILVVTDDCTITLDSDVSVESIIFDVAAGKTLNLSGSYTITAANGIYIRGGTVAMTSSVLRGTVKGNGTLYYNGVRPTTSGTDVILTDSDWRGTVRITYNYANTASGGDRALYPQHWGSANSKILWNGVAGYFGGLTSTAGWILEDLPVDATTYPALRKNDGISTYTTTAPSLEGSGEFADASNPSERFHFATGSSFSGKINITSSAGNGMNVQFGENPVGKVARTIHVLSGATVTVAAGKTWVASGGIVVNGTLIVGAGATVPIVVDGSTGTVQVLDGASLNIGTARPTIAGVAAGGTLAVTSNATMSERITGYTPTATLTVSGTIAGTVTLDGETVTPVVDGSTATLTGTAVAGNPSYTGNGWWWDYEFTGNGNNIGSEGNQLSWDGGRPFQGSEYTAADETGNQMLHLPARPWRDVTAYPSEFTAVMFCKAGATANGVLVAFGSTTWGSTKTITLSTGANPSAGQMRLVYGSGQNSSTDLVEGGFTLDNITSANHLYAFTVKTVGGVSQIAVYADGDLLTTYTADSLISLGSGFQIASGHGGLPSGLSRLANDDAATMDFLRVSNVALSDAAIKALAAEYRYVSPNGIAERTLSANATWTDETNTSWSQKTLNEDGSTTTTAQAAPNSGTVVEITASTDVQLTMDLASDVSYEKLTFQGDGSITVKAGGTAPTVTTRTYINTDVTMDIAAFASLGATTIADGKTLTVVPDETSTLNAGIALGIRGETSTIVTGTVTLGTGSQVVLPSSMVSDFASYGFTLTLTSDASGRYVYTIARDDNPVYVTKAANGTITYAMYPDAVAGTPAAMALTLPAEPATIPDDFAYTVTVANNHASESLTVATDFAGGSIAVSSGTVELSGDSSVVNVSGSGTVQVTGSLAVSGTFANTLTLAGDGTVTFATLPASALTFGTWTGTVVLPQLASIAGDTFSFNSYGVEGSTVRVSGIGGGWLKNEEVNPTIDIPEGVTLTISDFSASFNNTFKALSGAGTFAVTYNTAIDTTSGSWYSNYSAYFLVKNVSNFTGSLSTATPGIAIGASKPAYNTPGGKIYLTSVDATLAASATPAPETTVEGYYVKQVEGVYSLESFKVITFKNYDETVLQTISDARLGDTPAYTGATPTKPADAQYTYTFDAWDPVIAEVAGNATYTATYTSTLNQYTLTIPVVEHATAVVKVGGVATDDRTFDYGTAITIEWAAASGYRITAGATQMINSIAANTTADTPTVEAMGATVSNVAVSYGSDYTSAEVTATVSDSTLDYYISWGSGEPVKGTVSGSTVRFDVSGIVHSEPYQSSEYNIAAKDGETAVTTTGGTGSTVAADVINADWINERAASATGTSQSAQGAGGEWTNAVTYTDGKAEIGDNRFAATTASTASRVVLEFEVCFSSASEETVSGDAQAAIKLGEDDNVTTFMVLTNGNNWAAVSNAGLPIEASETYNVVLTIDYGSKTYKVDVDGNALTNSAGVASFALASSSASVQNIDFAGSGTLTSLKGSQFEGYMVKDALNNFYATIQAATQAYNSANGPYTVLHDGTPPDGWKIDGNTLIKLAKGFFFMAY